MDALPADSIGHMCAPGGDAAGHPPSRPSPAERGRQASRALNTGTQILSLDVLAPLRVEVVVVVGV
eukprot:6311878-Alexandrium_andersonii.AAC.1